MKLAYYIRDKLLKKGADDVVISVNNLGATQLKFVNNKIAKTGSEVLLNLNIFLSMKKKIIATTLKEFDEKNADKLISNLIKTVKTLPENRDYDGISEGPFKYKKIKELYDKKINSLDNVDLLQKGMNAALENSKRTSGILETYNHKTFLLTSNNVEAESRGTNFYFSIRAFNEKDESGHKTTCSRMLNKFQVEEAGKEAGKIAKLAKKPIEGKAGKYHIIFSRLAFAPLLNNVMQAASIFEVEAGLSFLADKLNKKLGDFTLIDNATLPNGYSSNEFDDEGTPSKKNVVINNGVLKTYLHNTSTAKRHKTKSTANAGLIAPDPSNIILEKGKVKEEKLLHIENGLYVTNVWYTRFQNYHTGDFSTIPRDGIFLIKNGSIESSIKNIRISDNVLNMLKNISLIGNKLKQIKSWEAEIPVTTPRLVVKNVNVTKPKI